MFIGIIRSITAMLVEAEDHGRLTTSNRILFAAVEAELPLLMKIRSAEGLLLFLAAEWSRR
jgi:hypothetical protein